MEDRPPPASWPKGKKGMVTKKKPKRRSFPLLLIVFLVCLALGAGYFFGRRGTEQSVPPPQPKSDIEPKQPSRTAQTDLPFLREKIPPEKTLESEDKCKRIEKDLADFFDYLDKRPYVQQIEPGLDTRAWVHRVILRLAETPPIPAGEGLEPAAIANHIFFFFRTLQPIELRLLKEILVNESSTIEPNLDLFYRAVLLENQCPMTKKVCPPPEVLYSYAGFFLNTIGGRAYLFRISPDLRLLATYYCILILHDADQRGKNTYGIDLAPHVRALSKEMTPQTNFLFIKEYRKKLDELVAFYRR